MGLSSELQAIAVRQGEEKKTPRSPRDHLRVATDHFKHAYGMRVQYTPQRVANQGERLNLNPA